MCGGGGRQGEEDHRLYVCVWGGGVREKRIIGCMCVCVGGGVREKRIIGCMCVCVWGGGSQGEEDHRLCVCVGGESGRRGS